MAQELLDSDGFLIKTPEQHFIDWERSAFGFGYGTGEDFVLPALKKFMALIGVEATYPHCYDHRVLERELGGAVAWLLINALAPGHADLINYGSSPRFAWLDEPGMRLKDFIDSKTDEELIDICCRRNEDYIECSPDVCNCGPEGHAEGRKCPNPFWPGRGNP